MARLPDFVCAQTIERAERGPAETQFRLKDRLHLEVTSFGGRERFAKAGGARFEDRELHDQVTRGVVATGGHALFLRHVTRPGSATFRSAGEAEFGQRQARRYDFDVPWERSGYTISVPPHQARVAFHGSLLADRETRDILELEVIADELPPELGFDRTRTALTYRLVPVDDAPHLFAAEAETLVASLDGREYRNLAKLGVCRRYIAESVISFAASGNDSEPPPPSRSPNTNPAGLGALNLRANLLLEITLDRDIAFASAGADSPFRATLVEPLHDGDKVIAPAGSAVLGRTLALERVTHPVDRYEVVLRLDSLELPGDAGTRLIPLSARLRDTGGGAGLIREEKRLMPVFNKKRGNRFSVLVRESGPEQAVLYWDARHPQIRKGFRMRWLTDSPQQ